MSTSVSDLSPYSDNPNFIPRLENGDRLTRAEFHRRYEAMPKNVKAELIKGIVYMASPVSAAHGIAHARIMSFIGLYQMMTPGIVSVDNGTYIAGEDHEPQPDAVLRIDERHGGRSWVNEAGYIEGSPELVVEVAASSASYDLHEKLELYQSRRVQEYLVWRVLDGQIDWYRLVGEEYRRCSVDEKGTITSRVFPGLNLNVEAMLSDDSQAVLADLQVGIASKDHADFVEHLRNSRRSL